MSRESLDEKAARLILRGRVRIHQATSESILASVLASVLGDTGNHLIAIEGSSYGSEGLTRRLEHKSHIRCRRRHHRQAGYSRHPLWDMN